jgi:hypothetical protein
VKVLDTGHSYELDHLDGSGKTTLTFVKREGEGYPGNIGHHEGIWLQELWRAEIERVTRLNQQVPCMENIWVLRNLRDNIRFLEERAARRHGRNPDWRLYEKDGSTNDQIEYLPTCQHCGHIGCPLEEPTK